MNWSFQHRTCTSAWKKTATTNVPCRLLQAQFSLFRKGKTRETGLFELHIRRLLLSSGRRWVFFLYNDIKSPIHRSWGRNFAVRARCRGYAQRSNPLYLGNLALSELQFASKAPLRALRGVGLIPNGGFYRRVHCFGGRWGFHTRAKGYFQRRGHCISMRQARNERFFSKIHSGRFSGTPLRGWVDLLDIL